MERAQAYVDIIHVSRGNIFFNYGSTFTIPTYFKGRQLNVAFAAEAKKRLHVPVAVVGNITSLQEAEDIIGSGKADIVVMAKSYMADEDLIHKSIRGHAEEVRPCTRCDWCGNANNFGTSMRCAINPLLGQGHRPVEAGGARTGEACDGDRRWPGWHDGGSDPDVPWAIGCRCMKSPIGWAVC